MSNSDRDYFRQRAEQEQAAARHASSDIARLRHEQLAELYRTGARPDLEIGLRADMATERPLAGNLAAAQPGLPID